MPDTDISVSGEPTPAQLNQLIRPELCALGYITGGHPARQVDNSVEPGFFQDSPLNFGSTPIFQAAMYILDPAKKEDPVLRWGPPDRIFFGYGACHILAGVYLADRVDSAFKPRWIKPSGFPGMHVFVSNGLLAFDYHGYSLLSRLIEHHHKVWTCQHPGWHADVCPVDFDLLNTAELNQRNMRGSDQYLGDAAQRARQFIKRIDHDAAQRKAQNLAQIDLTGLRETN